ncbi:MAG TPA: aminopeptidase [Symbiobacteriaceae bacterium]|nr:aminopeptidase [Symbiobacteriaceae bacterium]
MNPTWAVNLLQHYMGLKPGERVLVLVDEPLRFAGEALCAVAGAETTLRVVPPPRALAVVPDSFLRQVEGADVILSLFSGLDLVQESPLLRAGLATFRAARRGRWGTGACIDESVLAEELSADCRPMVENTAATAAQLARVESVRIVCQDGSDLRFLLGGRPVHQDNGQLHAPGAFGNLPAGEAYVAPLEHSAEGRLVVDLSLGDILLDEPVVLTFREGRVVSAEGGEAARILKQRLGADADAWTLGEFGLGTNPGARIRHRAPLDEKVLGTAHIALGGNLRFGGANPAESHYDCVIGKPKIYLDGCEIL